MKLTHFDAPPMDSEEVLRYARCGGNDGFLPLVDEVAAEMARGLRYDVVSEEYPINRENGRVTLAPFDEIGDDLARHLDGCDRVVVFAATVGMEPDRLIRKYAGVSPTKSLFASAVGSERVEAVCDTFCETYAKENGVELVSRFSPGYGDFPLCSQTAFFRALDVTRILGVTLTDSLLMTPTKSVTAVVGILSSERN